MILVLKDSWELYFLRFDAILLSKSKIAIFENFGMKKFFESTKSTGNGIATNQQRGARVKLIN